MFIIRQNQLLLPFSNFKFCYDIGKLKNLSPPFMLLKKVRFTVKDKIGDAFPAQ
jgi:hypothetical protein